MKCTSNGPRHWSRRSAAVRAIKETVEFAAALGTLAALIAAVLHRMP